MNEYENLRVKSIDELIVPEQLQALVHITSGLVNNPNDETLLQEILELVNNSTINSTTITNIMDDLSLIFPKYNSSYSQIYKSIEPSSCCLYFLHKASIEEIYNDNLAKLIIYDNLDYLINNIDESTDFNQVVKGLSLIDISCKFGSEKCFLYLKMKEAKISDNTFFYAVEGGCKNIIISLFNDKSYAITDKHLSTALKYHHNSVFDWLLETKGSFLQLNIAECFYYKNILGLLFLIENGFDVNKQYEDGEGLTTTTKTPLLIALEMNSFEIVQFLVEHGADINMKTDDITPLTIAIKLKSLQIVQCLVDHGADVNATSWIGRGVGLNTPLSFAIVMNSFEIVQFLIEHGVNVNTKVVKEGEKGKTPLSIAVGMNSFEIVKILIENGADVNTINLNNKTPLSLAVENKSLKIVQILVENGADVNMYLYTTPLLIAAKKNSFEIVQFLVEHGADVNTISWDGNVEKTPLAAAVEMKSFKIVQYLIEHGADPRMKVIEWEQHWLVKKGKKSILSIAKQSSTNEIIQYIQSQLEASKKCRIF